jgi:hypothetical protein
MVNNPFKSEHFTSWSNFHKTISVNIKDLFTSMNPKGKSAWEKYNFMTTSIQEFIQKQVIEKKTTMRPFGSGWSWTEVNTTTNGVMLDTSSNFNKGMDLVFKLSPEDVLTTYQPGSEFLVFSQCGKGIRKLNKYLEGVKRSLKTSGASDGQTIVGAMSTGTHGSNLNFGAIHDFVAGIHIITGPGLNDHIWIERNSHKVVSIHFLNSLKLSEHQLISDDDVFNSALVCFGSFGFIHGVLLETEEIFQMKLIRQTFPYNEKLVKLMSNLDVNAFGFPDYKGQELCHLQVVFDPYDFDPEVITGTAIITYGYQLPKISALPKSRFSWLRDLLIYYSYRFHRIVTFFRKLFSGVPNDIVHVLSNIDQYAAMDIPTMTAIVLRLSYKNETQQGTLGELFTGEGPPSALAGSSMCVDLSNIEKTLKILKKFTPKDHPQFAGVFSLRFVKSSPATLACTHFGKVTCVIEADGILNDRTKAYYHDVWNELRAANIPFTFHWGKLNDLEGKTNVSNTHDAHFVDDMYGPKVNIWKTARDKILTNPEVRKLFVNDTLKSWGLD